MSHNPRVTIKQTINARTPLPSSSVDHTKVSTSFNKFFASQVFSDYQIEVRVPKHIFESLKKARQEGTILDPVVADVVAQAMKVWAVEEHGATHYTHWFQPLRSTTAEKHDSFINFRGSLHDLRVEFSGDELLRGEPDASSFPNGELRATHTARGYTSWDPSSPAFITKTTNGTTLYIPTKYISWTGQALDFKTPLIKSSIALSNQAIRVLRLLGDNRTQHVYSTLGAEQEFFVIDSLFYQNRPDLYQTGRTVLGAAPAKGQQMEDHYFAPIPGRIQAFIQEVEHDLWKIGVPVKTRHNEVAPGQHEMAPIFEEANVATDHNLLKMYLLQSIAERHGLTVLLNEKPFKGVNGSGKHNNWSMSTDWGDNLLNPSKKPVENIRFQLFLAAVIQAVDEHADLLRISVAHAANDHRLGANEAPPAIVSVYLGEDLESLVSYLTEDDTPDRVLLPTAVSLLNIGQGLSPLRRDTTDRNRTSPFAFTSNKFEFRAPGSSQNCGGTIMTINLILADSLCKIADRITDGFSKISNPDDLKAKKEVVSKLIQEILAKHRRIIFNGDGYSEEWVKEAESRGLPNLRNTPEALSHLTKPKNITLFEKFKVLSKEELTSRRMIMYEEYTKQVLMEAKVLENLTKTHVLPAAYKHQRDLAQAIQSVKIISDKIDVSSQIEDLKIVSELVNSAISLSKTLHGLILEDHRNTESEDSGYSDFVERAQFVLDKFIPAMNKLREVDDKLEEFVNDEYWTLPKYAEMLHLK
eukprot:TRINITY_DN2418_c0_g1_i1.p1 TRINITY_DN2418_c0_g1~~TRINITY_DN2418_c0_g1_i1.p1  ORF type:complete len:753 (-),score=127.88 TRINITY_DN2418_c0_g1_i1:74-2332(-)